MAERGWGRMLFATSEIARGTQANPLGAIAISGGIGLCHHLAKGVPSDQLGAFYSPPAEDLAPMPTWLCTDAASDVTGQVVHGPKLDPETDRPVTRFRYDTRL